MGKKNAYPVGERPWRDQSTFAGGPGKPWTKIAAIIVIGTCVVASAIIVLLPHPATPHLITSTSSTGSRPGVSNGPGTTKGVCGQAAESGDSRPPNDVVWLAVYSNSWPTSATAGPQKMVDGLRQCFAHSPIGAALAGVNLTQSLRTADLPTAHKILDHQYAQNAGQIVSGQWVDKTYPDLPPASRDWGRVMGYNVLAYTPTTARVLLVENWPQAGQYTGYTVTLNWSAGDWQIVLDADGQPSPDGQITVDPSGFTPWAATK